MVKSSFNCPLGWALKFLSFGASFDILMTSFNFPNYPHKCGPSLLKVVTICNNILQPTYLAKLPKMVTISDIPNSALDFNPKNRMLLWNSYPCLYLTFVKKSCKSNQWNFSFSFTPFLLCWETLSRHIVSVFDGPNLRLCFGKMSFFMISNNNFAFDPTNFDIFSRRRRSNGTLIFRWFMTNIAALICPHQNDFITLMMTIKLEFGKKGTVISEVYKNTNKEAKEVLKKDKSIAIQLINCGQTFQFVQFWIKTIK